MSIPGKFASLEEAWECFSAHVLTTDDAEVLQACRVSFMAGAVTAQEMVWFGQRATLERDVRKYAAEAIEAIAGGGNA